MLTDAELQKIATRVNWNYMTALAALKDVRDRSQPYQRLGEAGEPNP